MSEQTQPMSALGTPLGSPGQAWDIAKGVVAGRESLWSREQFQRLALLERVRLLAGGELRFFRKGVEVPVREALRDL
jgi:hypothetical protein